jgi:hypothetical protein
VLAPINARTAEATDLNWREDISALGENPANQ